MAGPSASGAPRLISDFGSPSDVAGRPASAAPFSGWRSAPTFGEPPRGRGRPSHFSSRESSTVDGIFSARSREYWYGCAQSCEAWLCAGEHTGPWRTVLRSDMGMRAWVCSWERFGLSDNDVQVVRP